MMLPSRRALQTAAISASAAGAVASVLARYGRGLAELAGVACAAYAVAMFLQIAIVLIDRRLRR